MPKTYHSETDQESAYRKLKEKIIYLDFDPGQKIKEKEIREELEIGRTPLREIFIKLEEEGLVQMVPNSGTYITEVSFQSLRDVFEVRQHLIGLAGELAAKRINEEEINKIEEVIGKMEKESDSKRLMKLDSKVHSLINKATKNEALYENLQKLRQQAIRIWIFPHEKSFMSSFADQFRNLLEALKEGDQDLSKQILQEHTKHFIHQIKDQLF